MGKKCLLSSQPPPFYASISCHILCTLLCPQQAKVLHTLLCLETPSERAIKQENNSFVFFCRLCVLCSEFGHYTVNILACVAWRFCRAGRRSGVAAKFAREARENERRSREKVASAQISSRFLCPRPPLSLSAPNQNRHATQAIPEIFQVFMEFDNEQSHRYKVFLKRKPFHEI